MTKLNLDYYNDNKGYTDGSIEIKLREELKQGKTPKEILSKDSSWEALYHLSDERGNILSWFPFKENSRILEVGSGCGALTALLADKAKEVVSVELTKNRAEVNYTRNKDLENVEIIVGNFNDIKFEQKFDYIILNGVLEYAGSFTKSKKPYLAFLEKLKKLLTEDGEIITAIENRIGLKYFNGAPEDHTGRLFSGLNNYPGIDSVKTFTKKELEELFISAGFDYLKFFYPYPDYKLPNLILDDSSLNLINIEGNNKSYNINRLQFFDPLTVTTTFLKEGLLNSFMNSFLLVASQKPINIETCYVKFPQERSKDFSLVTSIINNNDSKKVLKIARYPEAQKHLDQIYQNFLNYKDQIFTLVPTEKVKEGLLFDYIDSNTLEDYLISLLEKGDKEAFRKELIKFKDSVLANSVIGTDYDTDEFRKVFGDYKLDIPMHLKELSNLDLIFTNIMNDENNHVIDYEWIFDFKLPQEFVLFRSLYYFYNQNHLVRELLSFEDLIDLINSEEEIITPEMIPAFIQWDNHFGNEYVSSKDEIPARETVDVSEELRNLYEKLNYLSSLYIDTGKGISEENRIKAQLNVQNNKFKITYDLSQFKGKQISDIRWDPVESDVLIKNLKIKSDKGDLVYQVGGAYSSEAVEIGNDIIFLTNDPYLILIGDLEDISSITISGEIESVNDTVLENTIKNLIQDSRDNQDQIYHLKNALNAERFHRLELEDLIYNLRRYG